MGGCESKATTANEFQVDAARFRPGRPVVWWDRREEHVMGTGDVGSSFAPKAGANLAGK